MVIAFAQETIASLGLTDEEYRRVCEILGREPNLTELGIFSVMWSEHCSYKSSKVHLQRLPTEGSCVVQGPGENAGVVDIGDGLVAIFKIESHNHPSYIEPYQGAATGVGGIIRDIFTMGARPIALMDALHFGAPEDSGTRPIVEGVVSGIGGYGNCIGIPTIGGQTVFSPRYGKNPIVNVMCLGIAARDQVFYGRATGVGNPVFYVGAKTGRDGIHGATMASEEFDDRSQEKRPTVQVGDPFMEKLLLEACLEAMQSGYVVGIQDMGAAGLTCSTSEMGSRAGTGMEIELDLVPQREAGMTAYEIMLSESQERMLLVASPEHEDRVRQIFTRWGLDAVAIGRVTADGKLRVFHGGKTVAEIPNRELSDEAPVYHRPLRRPEYLDRVQKLEEHALPAPDDWRQAVLRMMSSPNLCRKRWIWEQYDYMVRTNTVAGPGFDAAVLRLKESRRLLAMSTDCNPRYCYLDPINGARAAVAEACRNIVCSGGLPLAATNCLNFASPENPETMWQFSQTVDGLRDACLTFNTPITGGNVSFYNETNGVGIYPTPVVGMVGILESESRLTPSCFRRPGDLLILLGSEAVGLGGSEFLEVFHGCVEGIPVSVDLALEVRVQRFLSEIIGRGWVQSAHDCSEGGLLVTALESALAARPLLGFELSAGGDSYAHQAFFGEGPSRVLLSVTEEALDPLVSLANEQGILIKTCGRVTSGSIRVVYNGVELLSTKSAEVSCAWDRALERWKFGGEIR
jgi:phosphoribosylformylglycinamidine synthase subunit PurL